MENGNGYDRKIIFGSFDLESKLQTLRCNGVKIHLAKRPFFVLLFLIENHERIVSRDELLEKFWEGHNVYDDALRKCVGVIRKALNDSEKSPRFIETWRGNGYRFIGKINEAARAGNDQIIEKTNYHQQFDEQSIADHRLKSNVTSQKVFFRLGNRLLLIVTGAVTLISFLTIAFFVYHREPKNNTAQTLPETIAARHSIAILPLRNLTGNRANDYLSDGITETLINDLSRLESLKVISRSSAFQFKDKNVSAQEIGEKLGVETILEGSLKQSGEQLRIEVRLVNAKDGSVLWTGDSEPKKIAEIFSIQDGITCQIVTELKIKLCGEVPPAARYTHNVQAYQFYLQGMYYRNRLSLADLKLAVGYFEKSLQVDPNYALAHEGLALTYTVMELNAVVPPGSTALLAESHALKALELDDSLAGAYLALGAVKTISNYDLAERERYYRQALLKNPNYRTAHLWLAVNLTVQGKFAEAETENLRAQELDPLSFGVHLQLAELYWYWRKPDKVIEQAKLMLTISPGNGGANSLLARAYAQQGDFEKAFAALKEIPSDNLMRVFIYAAAGRAAEARTFAEAFAGSDEAKNSPYKVGCVYALTGDKEKAFAWLEKAYQMRQADLVSMKIDPSFDELRGDPRFAELQRHLNLDDSIKDK